MGERLKFAHDRRLVALDAVAEPGYRDDQPRPIGAVSCLENYMPMLRMAMYDKGIALSCAPTADDRACPPVARIAAR